MNRGNWNIRFCVENMSSTASVASVARPRMWSVDVSGSSSLAARGVAAVKDADSRGG